MCPVQNGECKQWLLCCCWGMRRLLIRMSGFCDFFLTCRSVSRTYFDPSCFCSFFLNSKCKNSLENVRRCFRVAWRVEKYDGPGVELLVWLLLTTVLLSCYCPPFLNGHVCRIEMWGVFCPTGRCCSLTQENGSTAEQVPFPVHEVLMRQN